MFTHVDVFVREQILLDGVRVRRFRPVHRDVCPGHVDYAQNRRFRWLCVFTIKFRINYHPQVQYYRIRFPFESLVTHV